MGLSLTSRYAEVIQRSFATQVAWTWPRKLKAGEPIPDSRLTGKNISSVSARVKLQGGTTVETRIRALSQHDLVLSGADVSSIPVMGQVVDVNVCWDDSDVVTASQAIVHWSGVIAGQEVVALFTIDSLEASVARLAADEIRGEVRFPLDLPAAIEVSQGTEVFGRIADYSLSGCRFVAEQSIALDADYPLTVSLPNGSVKMTLRPRWVLNAEAGFQLGCTFAPEEGVLLACRHHPQPTGLSSPLRPQTTNWNLKDNVDPWA